jgi:quinohemoprotein ethanol dehydrogenase
MAKFTARTLVSTAAALALLAGSALSAAAPGGAPVAGRDWFSFGGDDDGMHYSPLSQINQANVKGLGLA